MDALKNSEPSDGLTERQRALAGLIGLSCLIILIALVVTGH